jgi:hypothetical protein
VQIRTNLQNGKGATAILKGTSGCRKGGQYLVGELERTENI